MPTYDYHCQSCGNRFEAWQKITDDPIQTCPTCGGPVRRVVSPVGLVFKGSGFYSTDNRGSGSSSVSSSSSSSGTSAPAASASEHKPSSSTATAAAKE
jgi:putative FmdB family regulatory protein